MATALENAVGWVETQAPDMTGKTEAQIVARTRRFEVASPDPVAMRVVEWFDRLTVAEIVAGLQPGESQRIEGFTVIRIGRDWVELRNSYGYAIMRRSLVVG